jgi:trehalose 6-phosphate synthase/phosphatase
MKKYLSFVLSNRLPVSVSKKNGTLAYSVSTGGLATAMSSLDDSDRLWIGWPGITSDDLTEKDKQDITEHLLEQKCLPVFLSKEQVALFYEGYSNDTLWPLFHYFQSYVKHDEKYWTTYKEVNLLFAKTLSDVAAPTSKIWVHDYQLMLAPGMIRAILPEVTIGFFLHIPFPSYEIFRQLPNRHEIIDGLLGSDMVGFHIYDYARHFLSSVHRIAGLDHEHGSINYGGRRVVADSFPIGIDYDKFCKELETEAVKDEKSKIRAHHGDRKIILSVDRLDYSKGILQRLDAYELLLRENPEYINKVSLVMIAVPSRIEVDTYKELRNDIELSISRINGEYSQLDWSPISYQFKNQPFHKIVALYDEADVALVTPLRDGMNLVAKEFVASKQTSSGVLILSEMAGAIDELPEAISINPNSTRSIKEGLVRALTMPEKEQMKKLRAMQKRIKLYDVKRWAADFMEQLEVAVSSHNGVVEKLISVETSKMITESFKGAKNRLLLLDYDGVLRKFVKSSKAVDAMPSEQTYKIIEKLSNLENTTVAIISGRTKEHLMEWFDTLPVVLVAEHGAWIRKDRQWQETYSSFDHHKKDIIETMKKYARRTTGAVVEEKSHSVVWHYRKVKSELAYARNANLEKDLQKLLAETDIEVHSGNKIIEVKPSSINKGIAAKELYDELSPDFTLCIGDDYTDEDMFIQLPDEVITIKVGLEESAAIFALKDVDAVLQLLQSLAESQSEQLSF